MIGDMYGDFSRLTFAPEKHFSAVLVQQGRVMLDADANEQTAVTLHYLRRLAADVIGPFGGPGPATADANFHVTVDTTTPSEPTLAIAKGWYYVHGLLCEADEPTTFYKQPEAFLDRELADDRLPDRPYVVYLRVWERHITAVEDPSIRELALGENGPDTAARSKIVWQVRATAEFPPGSGTQVKDWSKVDRDTARQAWEAWETTLTTGPRAALKAMARQPSADDFEPCVASPDARYRGLENQLYRVEVHTGGSAYGQAGGSATFKWSRDNGAAVFPLESLSGSDATVLSLGRDRGLGLEVGDWVELLDDRYVLRGERHRLLRAASIEPLDRLVVLEDEPDDGVGQDPELHPLLRRWDQQEGPASSGYATLVPGEGVLEVIETTDGTDGWLELIPARTAIGDVEWPQEAGGPAARPPTGVEYFYAPLALVDTAGKAQDLRSIIAPIAQPAP